MGDTITQSMSGFSGNQMVGDLMGAAGLTDPTIQRAIAPITDKAGKWLDGGMNSLKNEASTMLVGDSVATNRDTGGFS